MWQIQSCGIDDDLSQHEFLTSLWEPFAIGEGRIWFRRKI